MTDLELLDISGRVSYEDAYMYKTFAVNGIDYSVVDIYNDKSGSGLQAMNLETHLTKQFMCIQFQNLRKYFEKRDKMFVLSFVFI